MSILNLLKVFVDSRYENLIIRIKMREEKWDTKYGQFLKKLFSLPLQRIGEKWGSVTKRMGMGSKEGFF